MKTFGVDWSYGEYEHVETPVGQPCLYCEEPIAAGDQGVVLPFYGVDGVSIVAQHRECMIRSVVGSVGHQKKTCHCFGGTEEDPPGMSKRDAAKAAVALSTEAFSKKLH